MRPGSESEHCAHEEEQHVCLRAVYRSVLCRRYRVLLHLRRIDGTLLWSSFMVSDSSRLCRNASRGTTCVEVRHSEAGVGLVSNIDSGDAEFGCPLLSLIMVSAEHSYRPGNDVHVIRTDCGRSLLHHPVSRREVVSRPNHRTIGWNRGHSDPARAMERQWRCGFVGKCRMPFSRRVHRLQLRIYTQTVEPDLDLGIISCIVGVLRSNSCHVGRDTLDFAGRGTIQPQCRGKPRDIGFDRDRFRCDVESERRPGMGAIASIDVDIAVPRDRTFHRHRLPRRVAALVSGTRRYGVGSHRSPHEFSTPSAARQ